MTDRFYVPGHWTTGQQIALPETEARHVARVLRKQVQQQIEVFDGAGTAALATITEITSKVVRVAIHDPVDIQTECVPRLIIAVAPPKGDRFRSMLEKLTELGVDRFIPLRTSRSVVDPRDSKLEKLEQNMIAACKQCGRNRLPELATVTNLSDLLQHPSAATVLVGDQRGTSAIELAPQLLANDKLIIIGPEGGFTTDERDQLAQRGAQSVRAGRHVLRIETAAVALAAIFR